MFLLNALVARYKAWRAYHNTMTELSRLDDRELADMGFSYCDIERVAHQAAYGK